MSKRTADDRDRRFHDPEVQKQILAGGRWGILEWLCWNDPNGVYSDADCVAEGYPYLSAGAARELMEEQIARGGAT